MGGYQHEPVMSREVVDLLAGVQHGTVVDATAGGGGHARLLLEALPNVSLVGIDRDPAAVEAAQAATAPFGERAQIIHGGFEDLAAVVEHVSEGNIMGILFDLGVSSPQLDHAERGFSYWGDAPLDMRMDSAQALTAERVVNDYDEDRLAAILESFGEERYAHQIAARIVARRPLATTSDLVDAVKEAIPARARRKGGHPAARVPGDPHGGQPRASELGCRARRVGASARARRTDSRARVPLAGRPAGEGALRALDRNARAPAARPAGRAGDAECARPCADAPADASERSRGRCQPAVA